MKRSTVLSIAGSDPSGGAGIQADLKTMTAFGCYGMTAITAVTVQNTMGVSGAKILSADLVAAQIDAVFTDIRPDAVKIGMAGNAAVIRVIAEKLREYGAVNVVLDPVMVSTSGHSLLEPEAKEALTEELLPLASLSTPNLPETEALTGISVTSKELAEKAAEALFKKSRNPVLVKGGHREGSADDLLWTAKGPRWYEGRQIPTENSHGTGCTLSSAIASCLALGLSLEEAVKEAKDYLTGALAAGLDLGRGRGPVDHCFRIRPLTEEGGKPQWIPLEK